MNAKDHYLFWRPVTAINPTSVKLGGDGFGPTPGFDDGNAANAEQSTWQPLITTPNHPEYPAAHGSLTSAEAQVFTDFLGTDAINVDIHGFDPAGPAGNLNAVRHFATAADLRVEIVNARVWGGMHYRFSGEAGGHPRQSGRTIRPRPRLLWQGRQVVRPFRGARQRAPRNTVSSRYGRLLTHSCQVVETSDVVRNATKVSLAAGLVLAVSIVQSAVSAPSSDRLQFSFKMGVILGGTDCPDGTPGVDPARDHCVFQAGAVQVRGLGTVHVTTLHVVILSNASCPRGSVSGELKSAHGTLAIVGSATGCVNSTFGYGNYPIDISGSGGLSGVSGSGMIANQGGYVVTGTLSAPSSLFDVDSPVITGAVNKTVKATSSVGARVRFAVTARDGVDGRVAVKCHPASGTLFRIGRTHITCKAADSSANTANRSFIVTVKHA